MIFTTLFRIVVSPFLVERDGERVVRDAEPHRAVSGHAAAPQCPPALREGGRGLRVRPHFDSQPNASELGHGSGGSQEEEKVSQIVFG